MGNPALMTPHFQFSLPTPQPQDTNAKTSKGVKGYPNGWQWVLNHAKDTICSSILLQEPFLGSTRARVVATKCFHKAMRIEIGNGMVLEPSVFHLILLSLTSQILRKKGPPKISRSQYAHKLTGLLVPLFRSSSVKLMKTSRSCSLCRNPYSVNLVTHNTHSGLDFSHSNPCSSLILVIAMLIPP